MSAFRHLTPASVRHAHCRRMQRTGITILLAASLVGVTALLVAVELAIVSLLCGVAAFIAIDVLRRARRGLASDEDVVVVIDGARAWSERADGSRHHEPQALMGGQAFVDHLQLVIGDTPTRLVQLEIPYGPDERASVLASARAATSVALADRPSFGTHVLVALTAVPALVVIGLVAYRAVTLVALAGVVTAMQQLGPEGAASLVCAAALVLVLRLVLGSPRR